MKKLTLILVLAVFLAGCAANAATNSIDNPQEVSEISDMTSEALETAETTLYAEVTDIISNQVSVKVLRGSFDPNRMSGRGGMGGMGGPRASFDPENMPSDMPQRGQLADGEMPSDMPRGRWADGEMPSDMPQGGRWADGEMPSDIPMDGSASFPPMPTNEDGTPANSQDWRYTGEEREIIIPIGTPMKKISISFEDGSLSVDEKEADLVDIQNGSTINIVYASDDVNIKEVQILDMGNMRRGGFRSGGTGNGGAESGAAMPALRMPD